MGGGGLLPTAQCAEELGVSTTLPDTDDGDLLPPIGGLPRPHGGQPADIFNVDSSEGGGGRGTMEGGKGTGR